MADVVKDERREPYIGEKRKFLRDGYGTYVYENQYFKYEGEWMKGKKHGHGKLIMKDGTYYEGQFINGEINGNGFKYFSSSQSKYTGQFLNGEMHGHGTMQYKNGNTYEGQWYKNKKQGFGILRTGCRSVYEGTFHGHVRDGEGTQTYDNGDKYEGYWVLEKRQGHGDLWCADGSHYSGQFMNDMFNGEGVMDHASGIVYRGHWVNGFPVTMSTKIVLLVDESHMIIQQGHPFSIRVECRNDEDEVIDDQGRELQVMAGFKYRAPREGSALFDVIEDVADKPITTPFYDVVPYPLTDELTEVEDSVEEADPKAGGAKADEDGEDKGEDEGDEEIPDDKELGGDDVDKAAVALQNISMPVMPGDETTLDVETFPGTDAQSPLPADQDVTADVSKVRKSEEMIPMLAPVASKPTIHGVCEWQNLQLAPPPPMYRPFVIMEEEAGPKKKSKLAQIREKMEDAEEDYDGAEDEGVVNAGEPSESEGLVEHSLSEGVTIYVTPEDKKLLEMVEEEALERKNSQLLPGAISKQPTEPEKSTVSEEKFARTGEYILIVQDVTNPPFMGRRLEPAYLVLKLKKPKRIIVKKPKRICIATDDGEECHDVYEQGEEEDEDSDNKMNRKKSASVHSGKFSVGSKDGKEPKVETALSLKNSNVTPKDKKEAKSETEKSRKGSLTEKDKKEAKSETEKSRKGSLTEKDKKEAKSETEKSRKGSLTEKDKKEAKSETEKSRKGSLTEKDKKEAKSETEKSRKGSLTEKDKKEAKSETEKSRKGSLTEKDKKEAKSEAAQRRKESLTEKDKKVPKSESTANVRKTSAQGEKNKDANADSAKTGKK